MVKRGNGSWALLFGRSVVEHPKVSSVNRGWGQLVLGEASLSLHNPAGAEAAFSAALERRKSPFPHVTEWAQELL